MAKKKRQKQPSAASEADICFVIMPFGGWLDDYYASVYKPAIASAGLDPRRADDLFRPSTIVNDIWDYTRRAKILLADLSGKNPNVFYELGLAHALAKPVILIAESMEEIPFDLRALRIIVYDKNAPDWGERLQEKIVAALKEVLKAPLRSVLPAFLDVTQGPPKPTVTPHQRELLEIKQELDLLRRQVTGTLGGERVDIGPEEAQRVIRELVKRGTPDAAIVGRLRLLGPPAQWITDRIRQARAETPAAGPEAPAQLPLT